MTIPFRKGCYVARIAISAGDIAACQMLRHRCFYGTDGVDADKFDEISQHLMVEDAEGRLIATLRITILSRGVDLLKGYVAQHYDLSGLAQVRGPLAEIGRFCVDPMVHDADVLRVIWGALTRIIDAAGVTMMIGCTSFAGNDPAPYQAAFDLLYARHQGPQALRPTATATEVVRFATAKVDPKQAVRQMPALLRSYLSMGGWVGDHAVVDRQLGTLHVFTCVPVASIPLSRVKALRAVGG